MSTLSLRLLMVPQAPFSCTTMDEAKDVLAQTYAPEYCWATQIFKQPTPSEAAKALHNELVYSGWRSRAGIA